MKRTPLGLALVALAPALLTATALSGCGTGKKDSAPSFRQQEAAAAKAGGAPTDPTAKSGRSTNGGPAAPALPGDPGYKAP